MSLHKPNLDDLRIERRDRPAPAAKPWVLGGVLVVLLAGAALFFWLRGSQAVEVRTILAQEITSGGGNIDRTVLNASGYVVARREATVSSKVTGKVIEVLIEEGMK